MSRTSSLIAIAVAALSLSACGYTCGTAERTVANGSLRDAAGTTLADVRVDLSDNVNPSFLRLSVAVLGASSSAGAPLKGHVVRARLVTETGELLAEVPTGTSTLPSDAVVALNADLSSRSEYNRVRSALLTAHARVIVDTDLPGREHFETTLSDSHDVTTSTRRCSFGE